jgi:sulfite reductase alpha subunit-like flavoprotein/iron only hydrogenase large subunit-like protein
MISVRIDDNDYQVPSNVPILGACRHARVYVPSLCYHPDVPAAGHCGLCSVKIDGSAIAYACMTTIQPGMSITTKDLDVIEMSQRAFDSLMDMPNPPNCPDIENIMNSLFFKKHEVLRAAERANAITFSPDTCVKCYRCVRACADVMDIGVFDDSIVSLKSGPCISCGLCTLTCPTSALSETNHLSLVYRALANNKVLACIVEPAACVGVNEAFDCPREQIGADMTDTLVGACRSLGFRYVFDAKTAIDLVTVELAEEFLEGANRPFIPAVCPSVVNYIEKLKPGFLPALSKVKSPAQSLADLIHISFCPGNRISPKDIFIVQLTSCIAAKDEHQRMQLKGGVDAVLTVREFAKLLKQFGLDWLAVQPAKFDSIYSAYSSRAPLAATSGGWCEGILAFLQAEEQVKPQNNITDEIGNHIRTGEVLARSRRIRFAACDGIAAAQQLLQGGAAGEYDIIDINACPGGCAFGGGQPKLRTRAWASRRVASLREIAQRSQIASAYHTLDRVGRVLTALQSSRAKEFFRTHFEPQESAVFVSRRRVADCPVVVYGSIDSRAMLYARILSQAIKGPSWSMNRLSVPEMLRRKRVVFICATAGDDQFPGNARTFVRTLTESQDNLAGVNYAILALDKDAAAKALDKMLENRHAQPMIPISFLDTSRDEVDFGAGFAKWSNAVAGAFFIEQTKFGMESVNRLQTTTGEAVEEHPLRPNGFEFARVKEVLLLSPEDFHPAMRRIILELPPGMSYELGDQVCILPRNDAAVVDRVLKALGLAERAVFQHEASGNSLIPGRISMKQLFSQYVDLNGLPGRPMLAALCEAANDVGKSKLAPLVDPKSSKAFERYQADINTAECLCEFAQYGTPPLDVLVSAIPAIQPRFYAIASSPGSNKGTLDALVLEVRFGKDNSRHGLSTYFLAHSAGQSVPIFTRRGSFRYPGDITTPIIMVALGSGLSPILALLHYRNELDKTKLGPAYLFVGTRFQSSFPMLFKTLRMFVEQKILTELFHAVSREGPRNHVQDLMKQNTTKLWDLWQDHRTMFFYCGPKRGVPDELKEIMLSLTISEGWLAKEEAMAFSGRHEWLLAES